MYVWLPWCVEAGSSHTPHWGGIILGCSRVGVGLRVDQQLIQAAVQRSAVVPPLLPVAGVDAWG